MKQGYPAYIEYLADILTVGSLEERVALVDELMKEDKITFLQEYRIIFAKGAFFMPDGRVTDGLPLRGEIYDKLKFCAVNNIPPPKITNILEVLKQEAQVPDFPPEQDWIHLSNGTLLDGTFTEGRPAIVRNRLPVVYDPHAHTPVTWLNFLDGLFDCHVSHLLAHLIDLSFLLTLTKKAKNRRIK